MGTASQVLSRSRAKARTSRHARRIWLPDRRALPSSLRWQHRCPILHCFPTDSTPDILATHRPLYRYCRNLFGFTFQSPFEGNWWTLKEDRIPGDYQWDPMDMYPALPKERLEMQTKELNNGRLAMIAIAGMVA